MRLAIAEIQELAGHFELWWPDERVDSEMVPERRHRGTTNSPIPRMQLEQVKGGTVQLKRLPDACGGEEFRNHAVLTPNKIRSSGPPMTERIADSQKLRFQLQRHVISSESCIIYECIAGMQRFIRRHELVRRFSILDNLR